MRKAASRILTAELKGREPVRDLLTTSVADHLHTILGMVDDANSMRNSGLWLPGMNRLELEEGFVIIRTYI